MEGKKGNKECSKKQKRKKENNKNKGTSLPNQAESTAAQNYVNKNTDAYKYKAESDISFTKAESSAAQNYVNQITDVYNYTGETDASFPKAENHATQYHENKIIDVYNYKGETEGTYEYSDDDRKQLSDLSVKEREGAAKTITVFVRTIGRKTISVSCDTKQQMKQIKMKVTRRRKISEKMLCLVSHGKS